LCGKFIVSVIRSLLKQNRSVPLISYPQEAFLNRVMADLPPDHGVRFSTRAISSLTPAILEMALCGLGVGWVTESLAANSIKAGKLCSLSSVLPSAEMQLVMMRARGTRSEFLEAGWQTIKSTIAH
jgi:DNA-binding transcriptional LysR family regulator